jgi:AGCS family alanine or glycine:cation symporter
MGQLYLIATIIIIVFNIHNLIPTLKSVFLDAFSLKAGLSGFVAMIIIATQRTFFCTETGMGSASISHLRSVNNDSFLESIISTITPIISIGIICLCQGIFVSITNSYQEHTEGSQMLISSFETVHKHFPKFLMLIVPAFGISTSIAWAYYGQKLWSDIFGKKSILVYNIILFVFFWICGSTTNFKAILDVADFLNLSITIPNIIGLYILSSLFAKQIKTKFQKKLYVIDKEITKSIFNL